MKLSFLFLTLFLFAACGENNSSSQIEPGHDFIQKTTISLDYTNWYDVPQPYSGILRGFCLETPAIGCEITDDPAFRECSFECEGQAVVTLKSNEWTCEKSFWNLSPELYTVESTGDYFYQTAGKEKTIVVEAQDVICD